MPMPIYVYETIPANEGEEPERFEIRQSMNDAPLEVHPESGAPVRRVVSGGFGYMRKGGAAPVAAAPG